MPALKIASSKKIAAHGERIRTYLEGKNVFPVTLELDITSRCNRACKDCPSIRASESSSLDLGFIERLFASLEGQTGGLLLTGGEATLYPDFVRVLELAKDYGFREIAVVTNGSQLEDDEIVAGLLKHVTAIRISFYDWADESCGARSETLKRILSLRNRIEKERSSLQIGVSILTSESRHAVLPSLGQSIKSAGAHWVYFHPMCTDWGAGRPWRMSQDSVLEKLIEFRDGCEDGFRAYFLEERYADTPLHFIGYHAAHFLMVVGADGRNYLAPEVKYHRQHVIADFRNLKAHLPLASEQRLRRINAVNSSTYPAIGSRHRGELYSDYIEGIKDGRIAYDHENWLKTQQAFHFPFIL